MAEKKQNTCTVEELQKMIDEEFIKHGSKPPKWGNKTGSMVYVRGNKKKAPEKK